MLSGDAVSVEVSGYPWGVLKSQRPSDLSQVGARWKAKLSLDVRQTHKGMIMDKVAACCRGHP